MCAQALWFCMQILARIIKALPITLLELNTFAHSICALLIYIIWWNKPLDIEEPTVIKTQNSEVARDYCALAYAWGKPEGLFFDHWRSLNVGTGKPEGYDSTSHEQREQHLIAAYSASNSSSVVGQIRAIHRSPRGERNPPTNFGFGGISPEDKYYTFTSYDPLILRLAPGNTIPGTGFCVASYFEYLEVDEPMLARFRRLWIIEKRMEPRFSDFNDWIHSLAHREPNFTMRSNRDNDCIAVIYYRIRWLHIMAFTLSGLFYGGLHALSWGSAALTSTAESLLWKICCIAIIGTGPLIALGFFIWKRIGVLGNYGITDHGWTISHRTGNTLMFVGGVSSATLLLLFVFSRVFLIVEVFLSLGRSDPGVYDTLNWTPYWPHIS